MTLVQNLFLPGVQILYMSILIRFPVAQWKKLGLQALPPGLLVVEEIISSDDEKMLLESVNWTGDTDNQNCK